jgi:hypothetical protein
VGGWDGRCVRYGRIGGFKEWVDGWADGGMGGFKSWFH